MSDVKDVIIIGAGTAGLAAMRDVSKTTDNFLIINEPPYGTTCARVGCMPSKALIAAANAYHARHALSEFGITGGEALSADIPAVLRHVRTLRDRFTEGAKRPTNTLGPRNIAGFARLLGRNEVEVNGASYRARKIILATGSRPVVPGPWTHLGDRVITTDSVFEQTDLPARMGVIGLGAIGTELAQAIARLGVEVFAFDGSRHMAGISDDDINATLTDALTAEFSIAMETEVDLQASADGVEISWSDGRVQVDKVLVSVGRRPNIENLGLERLGVTLDERGLPEIDRHRMQIKDCPVYLAGDANGYRPLLHESADDGHIAGTHARGEIKSGVARRTPLAISFCSPNVVRVGVLPQGGQEDILIGEANFSSQGRARIMQQNCGLIKVYASRSTARILGAEMAAPAGEHMGHLLALAIDQKLTVRDMLGMPFYHPTLEEGLRSALRQLARALPDPDRSDLSECRAFGIEALD